MDNEQQSSASSNLESTDDEPLNLDNMPDDIYHFYLFPYLDLDDILELKLVSKSFYSKVVSYNIIELSFLNHKFFNYYGYKDKWLSTNKSTKLRKQLNISKLSLIKNPPNHFMNLKYLRMKEVRDIFVNIDDLNKFIKLEVLEARRVSLGRNQSLNLPCLEALSMVVYLNDSSNLLIHTPNLHSLHIHQFNSNLAMIDNLVKFEHPLSIKYLKLEQHENVSIFTNLECLELYRYEGKINDLLNSNLKTLKVTNSKIANKLNYLFESRKDLQIVLDGVRIKSINKLKEYKECRYPKSFQLDNYDEFEDGYGIVSITYDVLINRFPKTTPADLFNKLNNIQALYVISNDSIDVENDHRLIEFIKGFSNLSSLIIDLRIGFPQQFYDKLPAINTLVSLSINDDLNFNLNFKFIMKMPYLIRLQTDKDVQISEFLNLNSFKYLNRCEFEINNRKFNVYKEGRDRYLVENSRNLGLPNKYLSHDELVHWSNYLRNNRQY